jgi:hypothetical protein
MSREHIIPACLGFFRNSEPLNDKICGNCNNKFSLLDEQFCRCGPEAFLRAFLSLKGRKYHTKYSPFYRGSAGGKRIEIKSKHPTRNHQIYGEIDSGEFVPARQIIVQSKDGEYHPILVDENMKSPKELKRNLDKKGIKDPKFIECWSYDENDQKLLNRLCVIFNEKINWSDTLPYENTEKQLMVATVTVTNRYFRAIAKIAFHYLLKNFSSFSGFEKEFDNIKNFIINGGDEKPWVRQKKGFVVNDLKPGLTTNRYGHLFVVEKMSDHIIGKLQFFVGPQGLKSYYEIYLGKNPEKIIFPEGIGHQFVYFDKPDDGGFWGRMDQLISGSRIILP